MRKGILLLVTLVMFSCGSGHLTKRYKSIKIVKNDNVIKDSISVGAFFLKGNKPQPTQKTIFDLSPKAQKALIEEIGKKEKKSDVIIKKLSSKLSSTIAKKSIIKDYTTITKQVVLSVANKSHMPANRISKINISLDLGDNIKILTCNKVVTAYQTIDLGKINYSNTSSASITGSTNSGIGSDNTITKAKDENNSTIDTKTTSNGAGLSGTVTASQTFAEEVVLRQRRVALNALISDNKLVLFQEGIVGIDLSGNIIAEITFKIDDSNVISVFSFNKLFDSNNKALAPDSLKVNRILEIIPNITKDVSAAISYEAEFRQVSHGHQTISESDDKIKLYNGSANKTKKEVILTKEEVNNIKQYTLTFSNINSQLPVKIQNLVMNTPLVFNSYENAQSFALWLEDNFDDKKNSIKIANSQYNIRMPEGFTTIKNLIIVAR